MTSSAALRIPADERARLRLFAVDAGPVALKALREPGEIDPLPGLFGVNALDREQVDIFSLAELGEIALSDYLITGGGIPAEAIEPDRARLDAVRGHVMTVRTAAFRGRDVTLQLGSELTLLGCYPEERIDVRQMPLPSDAAQPYSGHPSPQPKVPEPVRRHRMGSLLVLGALIFFALFLWVLA